jgi:hypothetical protein
MKGGTQAALALGVGYVLGRRRKMRLATILAVGAATGGIAGIGGAAVRRGTKALGSPAVFGKLGPQFGQIAETVRGDLVDAGKAAAVAAVTGRIDSLTESLHERAESIRNPASDDQGYDDEDYRDEDYRDEPEDTAEADEDWDDEDEADEDRPAPRRRASRDRAPVSRARR